MVYKSGILIIQKIFSSDGKSVKSDIKSSCCVFGLNSALAKGTETSVGATVDHEWVVRFHRAALFRRSGDEWSSKFEVKQID